MNTGERADERFYRRIMAVYPPEYRRRHGAEMLGILLEDDHGGDRATLPRVREAAALIRHGVGLRLAALRTTAREPGSVLGPALVGVLAIVGLQSLLATSIWAAGWGVPDDLPATLFPWADPRWPIHLTWVMAGTALALGAWRTSRALTWLGAIGLVAYVACAATPLPWPVPTDEHWPAAATPSTLAWAALALAAAASLSRRRPAHARPRRWLPVVAIAGLAILAWVTLELVAGPAHTIPVAEQVRSTPAVVVAFALATTWGIARAHGGPHAVRFLAVAALPVLAQAPSDVALGGGLLAAGFLLGASLARRRPEARTSPVLG